MEGQADVPDLLKVIQMKPHPVLHTTRRQAGYYPSANVPATSHERVMKFPAAKTLKRLHPSVGSMRMKPRVGKRFVGGRLCDEIIQKASGNNADEFAKA